VILYVGASAASLVTPGQLYRVTFRNTANVLSLAFWDPWAVTVQRFVDRLPGGGYAFVIGTPAIQAAPAVPVQQEIAVCVLRVAMTALSGMPSLSLGEWTRQVATSFPGAEVTRVERVTGATIGGDDSELALEAGAADAEKRAPGFLQALQDWFASLGAGLKKAGLTVLIVAAVALVLYAAVLRGRLTAGSRS
jgi:hypothetical protein